ncbi:f-box-like domain-containing protein [Purpureocillium lavendulum]|uniref:F-box-like domain-containing protein n=1 Tax=Purpureocillium lavendulum TaxID=1247861 RepID=A0AB34FCP1_9HYPO|nr:f-box-like domain-containing protein [Purpureocillium lavendulum]
MKGVVTISAQSQAVSRHLKELSQLSSQGQDEASSASLHPEIEDALQRFQLWGFNLGSFRSAASRLSLDSRLSQSDAADIRDEILRQLDDILEVAQNLKDILIEPQSTVQSPGTHEVESDPPTDEPETRSEAYSEDDLDETVVLMDIIKNSISSLLRIGILVRKATPRDKFKEAQAATRLPLPDNYYVEYVHQKYPKLDETQYRRLGRAIASRRQFIMYCRDHKARLAHDEGGDDAIDGRTEALSSKASTFRVPTQEDLADDDELDTVSIATVSTVSDLSTSLKLPPLINFSTDDEPFECIICHTLQSFRSEKAWQVHAFRDLKAYVCTLGDGICDDSLFGDRESWFEHEMTQHRVSYRCSLCDFVPRYVEELQSHIRTQHGPFPQQQLQAVVDASRITSDTFKAADCPFCHTWAASLSSRENFKGKGRLHVVPDVQVSARRFKRHVARHQEELAIFAMPRHFDDDDDDAASAGEETGAETEVEDDDFEPVFDSLNIAGTVERPPESPDGLSHAEGHAEDPTWAELHRELDKFKEWGARTNEPRTEREMELKRIKEEEEKRFEKERLSKRFDRERRSTRRAPEWGFKHFKWEENGPEDPAVQQSCATGSPTDRGAEGASQNLRPFERLAQELRPPGHEPQPETSLDEPPSDPKETTVDTEIAGTRTGEDEPQALSRQREQQTQIREAAEQTFLKRMEELKRDQEEAQEQLQQARTEAEGAAGGRIYSIDSERRADQEMRKEKLEAMWEAEQSVLRKFKDAIQGAEQRGEGEKHVRVEGRAAEDAEQPHEEPARPDIDPDIDIHVVPSGPVLDGPGSNTKPSGLGRPTSLPPQEGQNSRTKYMSEEDLQRLTDAMVSEFRDGQNAASQQDLRDALNLEETQRRRLAANLMSSIPTSEPSASSGFPTKREEDAGVRSRTAGDDDKQRRDPRNDAPETDRSASPLNKPKTRPTYTRMARRHLSIETLRTFGVDYDIDENPDFVLVKRWVPEWEQDELWRHTRHIRAERLQSTKPPAHKNDDEKKKGRAKGAKPKEPFMMWLAGGTDPKKRRQRRDAADGPSGTG